MDSFERDSGAKQKNKFLPRDGSLSAEVEAACPFPGKIRHKRYIPYKYMQEPSVLITPCEKTSRRRNLSMRCHSKRVDKEYKRSEFDKLEQMVAFRQQVLTKQHTSRTKNQRKDTPLERGLKMIRQAAVDGLQSSRYSSDFRAFEGPPLEPHEFRRMMSLSFGVSLSKPELREVVTYFDEDCDGKVSLKEVMQKMLHPTTLIPRSANMQSFKSKERWL